MADLATVVWKEWKEILSWGGNRSKVGIAIFIAVFGIVLPLQSGRSWVQSPLGLFYWSWIPLFLVLSVIADSFAGERERHTLETLLASRLSDQVILLGKAAAAVIYGVGITWISVLLGLVSINLAHRGGGLILYPRDIGMGIVGLSLLFSGLATGAGVLVSLKAATVRQAQQTLSIAMMIVFFVPLFGSQALPAAWKRRLLETFGSMSGTTALLALMLVLAVVDLVLLLLAMSRFRRNRLLSE